MVRKNASQVEIRFLFTIEHEGNYAQIPGNIFGQMPKGRELALELVGPKAKINEGGGGALI